CRAAADDARAHGTAPQEPDVQFVPPLHRSDWPRARPVRCHGQVAGARDGRMALALDRFGVTGKWRARENGMPLDTRGEFYDGTPVSTPAELSAVLLKRPVPLVRTFTENLMAYALGRRVEYYDQPAVRAIAKAAQ